MHFDQPAGFTLLLSGDASLWVRGSSFLVPGSWLATQQANKLTGKAGLGRPVFWLVCHAKGQVTAGCRPASSDVLHFLLRMQMRVHMPDCSRSQRACGCLMATPVQLVNVTTNSG